MSATSHRAGTRVEDLVGERQARELLAGLGLEAPADRPLPMGLPCRALRVVPSGPAEAAALARAAEVAGAELHRGARAWLVAGAGRTLDEAAAWIAHDGAGDDGLASVVAHALAAFRRRAFPLRFADGAVWALEERTRLMGVLNVTPDSFFDGGRWLDPAEAVGHGERMADDGADIVDVGGESSRPGAEPTTEEEELRRVVPVVRALRGARPRLRISIDTVKATVARRALEAGADMINDTSGLAADPAMAPLAAQAGVPLVVMHLRGTPRTMQRDTTYDDLLTDVVDGLAASRARAREAGVADDRLLIDPGIGFGKSAEGSEEILRHLGTLRTLGLPVLVGASRKSFLGRRQGDAPPGERLEGSLAAAAAAIRGGTRILRVHDVRATARLVQVADAIGAER